MADDSNAGPTAIVTGGSRGLGRALIAGLLDDRWTVVTDGRRADVLASAAADLVAQHAAGDADRLIALPGDQGDVSHIEALVAAAEGKGGPDLLVLNAGDLGPSPLPHLDELEPAALTALVEA